MPALALLSALLFASISAAQPAPTATVSDIQPLSVTAAPSPDKVKLGEPFTFTVTLTHKPDQRYELLQPKDLGAFDLASAGRHREDHGESSTTTFTLKMALFAIGAQPLPALTFEVTDPSGVHHYVLHQGSVEGVSTLPADAAKNGEALADIKPNEPVPVRTYRLLWGLLALAVLAGLGYVGYRTFKKLRERALVPPPVPPLPLHERTLAALDALKRDELPQKGRAREFYFRLSEILRGYLGQRFRFEALECTSSELLTRVCALPNRDFPVGDFSAFVHESDLVKFAKLEPAPETCDASLEFGYRLVHLTHPPAVIPANALGPDVSQS